ncbi:MULTISPECIES: helix-turn-helix domain-containing protein [unclassified Blautia]|uniref:helix-turn-helix domain-containing protein n=1 Tax=unclassified Blautia TaxID=2648079 RepID=UPI001FD08359|nr:MULTISPECIES: helix-turn-helix domain-containing protein [unclassified Blautia]MCJ7861207.1 helix-turn-helix transcriptional regulator [Blautia sp. NSJ-157]MCJ7863989.1 helix-turn-helix transcriptional regulator [Blautia sp. NSJ-140]
MQNIVEFIKEEMSNRGMTYDLLAEKVGTSRQNLWLKLNKNTRPNFETIKKILSALDYDLKVEKKEETADPGEKEFEAFLGSTYEEQVSYECVQALLATIGYALKIKTQKNEENVKEGIDNY